MNLRSRTALTAIALAAAASTLNSRAADPGAADPANPRAAKPVTERQVDLKRWFELERQRGSSTGFKPAPYPPPLAPGSAPRETTAQLSQDPWWTNERGQDEGYAAPAPRPRSAGQASTKLP